MAVGTAAKMQMTSNKESGMCLGVALDVETMHHKHIQPQSICRVSLAREYMCL